MWIQLYFDLLINFSDLKFPQITFQNHITNLNFLYSKQPLIPFFKPLEKNTISNII